jgi:hypothetical protein
MAAFLLHLIYGKYSHLYHHLCNYQQIHSPIHTHTLSLSLSSTLKAISSQQKSETLASHVSSQDYITYYYNNITQLEQLPLTPIIGIKIFQHGLSNLSQPKINDCMINNESSNSLVQERQTRIGRAGIGLLMMAWFSLVSFFYVYPIKFIPLFFTFFDNEQRIEKTPTININ